MLGLGITLWSQQAVRGGGGVVTAATLNPADKSTVTLSNGNLTALVTGGGAQSSARATRGPTTGKVYWEVTVNADATGNLMLGVADSSAALTGTWWYSAGGVHTAVWYLSDGGVYYNGTNTGSGLGFPVNTDVLMFAWDADAKKLWVGRNGTWSGSPAAGTGGVSVASISSPALPAFMADGTTAQVTFNFGATTYAYTAPSGFGNV